MEFASNALAGLLSRANDSYGCEAIQRGHRAMPSSRQGTDYRGTQAAAGCATAAALTTTIADSKDAYLTLGQGWPRVALGTGDGTDGGASTGDSCRTVGIRD